MSLLPCPMCGGEPLGQDHPAHTHVLATFMPDHPGSYTIECPACNLGMIDEDGAACAAAWNRRNGPPSAIQGNEPTEEMVVAGLKALKDEQGLPIVPLYGAMFKAMLAASPQKVVYDAVADAIQVIADSAQAAFRKAGIEPGEWDSDDIVRDVARGIANDIERLTAKNGPSPEGGDHG